jgi:hypothetical protein
MISPTATVRRPVRTPAVTPNNETVPRIADNDSVTTRARLVTTSQGGHHEKHSVGPTSGSLGRQHSEEVNDHAQQRLELN